MTNDNFLESSFSELLRVEGINFKGFGIIPKFVMLDTEISIEAKAIYAYFCSLSGNGQTSFPSLNSILKILKLNKDTYYKHLNILITHGYLKKEQQRVNGGDFGHNIYTLISNPKKFSDYMESSNSKVHSKLRFSGIKSHGYGLIPRAVMQDPRLSLKAKGIYAYFCSFTGSGNSAFPKKDIILHHLQITKNTYYKFYNQLIELNYITVIQRYKNGKLGLNDYYLNDNPDDENIVRPMIISEKNQCPNFSEALNQCPNFSDPQIQDPQISETTINNITINNIKYNQSNLSNEKKEKKSKRINENMIDRMDEIKKTEKLIRENIDFDILLERDEYSQNDLNTILMIITEVVCATSEFVKISGEEKSSRYVKEQFLKLNHSHITYVLDCIKSNTTKIKNIKAYLITSLYNSIITIDSYYETMVNHDLKNLEE